MGNRDDSLVFHRICRPCILGLNQEQYIFPVHLMK